MVNSPVIAALHTTIPVSSASEKPLRQKSTHGGKTNIYIHYTNDMTIYTNTVTPRFVEMLESHHSLVVKALQKLYKFCINNEGFPGEPLEEAQDGYPLTHAILDRLGLIKQAEENADEPDEDSEDLRYLRLLSTSTECSATAEPSPEPTTPPEPSPPRITHRASNPLPTLSRTPWPWDLSMQNQNQNQNQNQSQYYADQAYQSHLLMHRASVPVDLPADLPPHVDLSASMPPRQSHDQSFTYYLDSNCADAQPDVKPARLHGIPEHAQIGSVPDMLSEFQFHGDSAFFPGFTPGWTFPS